VEVVGEEMTLDGAGGCVLLPPGAFSARVDGDTEGDPAGYAAGDEGTEGGAAAAAGVVVAAARGSFAVARFDCAEARAARCGGCGLFLGFRLDGGVGPAPALHAGDLCVPRAFLVRRPVPAPEMEPAEAQLEEPVPVVEEESGVVEDGGVAEDGGMDAAHGGNGPAEARGDGPTAEEPAAAALEGADAAAAAQGAAEADAPTLEGAAVACAAEGCGARLTSAGQLLSRQHSWRLETSPAGPPESAFFVNAAAAGAVRQGAWERRRLAQGEMACASLRCAACGAEVGWRFGARADPRDAGLLAYEGRLGLVRRCVTVQGDEAGGDGGLEDDVEDEPGGGARGALRLPLSLLRQLFAMQTSGRGGGGDSAIMDLAALLRR
jgi:hypothetical protein